MSRFKRDLGDLPQRCSLMRCAIVAVILLVPAIARTQDMTLLTEGGQDAQPQSASPATDLADAPGNDPVQELFPHFKNTRYWLSGQANFIFQTHPPFHAPYSGKNSLDPNYEKATSRVLTLYTGVRLNNSTELLVDIEDQIRIQPELVLWRVGEQADPKKIEVTVADDAPVKIVSVLSDNPSIKAELSELKPGKKYEIQITPTDLSRQGGATILIHTDYPPQNPQTRYAYARIK